MKKIINKELIERIQKGDKKLDNETLTYINTAALEDFIKVLYEELKKKVNKK